MARTPGSVTRKVSDRAALRQASSPVLKEALERLTAGGRRATEISVEEWVQNAGLSRSAFYRHYADKGEVLVHLMEGAATDIMEAATAWWQLPPHPAEEELHGALRSVFDAYRSHRVVLASALELSSYDDRVRQQYDALVDLCAVGLAEHIKTGQAAGVVDAHLDPMRTASWLTWMAERGFYRLAGAPVSQVKVFMGDLTRIVANTLYARTM
jgi:TetR/AcrR family transcriptional regulator, ethionamide resistance regulator